MHLVENTQRPASDDINPDALEYLFGQNKPPKTPWLDLASSSEPIARITPEHIRLQTKVEVLKGALELTIEQAHEAHQKIGMLSAELARRDVMLRDLADYRAKAALAIGYRRQNELLRAALEQATVSSAYELEGAGQSNPPVNAFNYVVRKKKRFVVSSLLINAALVLGFALAVLTTILH